LVAHQLIRGRRFGIEVKLQDLSAPEYSPDRVIIIRKSSLEQIRAEDSDKATHRAIGRTRPFQPAAEGNRIFEVPGPLQNILIERFFALARTTNSDPKAMLALPHVPARNSRSDLSNHILEFFV
jgi:hypothetical protein